MSAVFCRNFKQAGQRLIGLITLLPASQLQPVVTRFLRGPGAQHVTTVELWRDNSTGVKVYQWTVVLEMDERSPADVITDIFGADFLDRHLPITDQSQMRTGDAFLRVGSLIKPGQQPTTSELFVINEMIQKSGTEMGKRQWDCTRAFDAAGLIDEFKAGEGDLYDSAADNVKVCEIARQHKMDGGSWLLYPDHRMTRPSAAELKQQCIDIFTRIAAEYLEGTLPEDYITRITYAPIKGVVKVTNEKTRYFEFVERQNPVSPEDRFSADTQVKTVFLKLVNMHFRNTKLKYKPEIFSVWKLNTENTKAFLSIYTNILHDKKKELASA